MPNSKYSLNLKLNHKSNIWCFDEFLTISETNRIWGNKTAAKLKIMNLFEKQIELYRISNEKFQTS